MSSFTVTCLKTSAVQNGKQVFDPHNNVKETVRGL